MKSTLSWQDYQRMELIKSESRTYSAMGFVRNLLNEAMARFTATTDPQIWTTKNRNGQVQWNAYDPMTQQSINFLTEDDLRIWLENRHYRSEYLAG